VEEPDVSDYQQLPSNLPVPQDDGAADHLPGAAMPPLVLRDTNGNEVALDQLGPGRTVIYIYPLSGRPGVDLPAGWDAIPGARGCTPENCSFRDHQAELAELGARVHGLSSQPVAEQREFAEREHMPFALLNDSALKLRDALGLPTFEAGGMTLYKRLTLVARQGRIERIFYPVFPPDTHVDDVLAALRV
jgi:peroxiredoxin